ncbi:MAG: hypothetical protein EOM26_03975 [Alphaproteobacteria bacterium]|nr:hypothetical protein [Alphaproteobacteria bacterium]
METRTDTIGAILRENRADPSLWGLVAGNFFSIVMALLQGWELSEIMWIYWVQSVVIGMTNFARILSLREFSTDNFTINDRAVEPTQATKIQTAFFFLIHYGIFHAVYAGFLWDGVPLPGIDGAEAFVFALCAAAFAGAHGFSFVANFRADFRDRKPNIGSLMFYPYFRIVPMHLTIILGGFFATMDGADGLVLISFMVLKTIADGGMHIAEHRLFRKEKRR